MNRIGSARANSIMKLPRRSAASRLQCREIVVSIGLLENLALGYGRGRGDTGGRRAVGRAARLVVVVERLELEVAADPDRASGCRGTAESIDARHVDAVVGEVDRP